MLDKQDKVVGYGVVVLDEYVLCKKKGADTIQFDLLIKRNDGKIHSRKYRRMTNLKNELAQHLEHWKYMIDHHAQEQKYPYWQCDVIAELYSKIKEAGYTKFKDAIDYCIQKGYIKILEILEQYAPRE